MTTRCPQCSSENLDDSKFCKECGTQLIPLSVTKTLKVSTPLSPGKIIAGKYKILSEIGRGGMGVVYKAEDLKLKRCVAIKFLPTELTRDTEAKERFVREAQAAAALSHANICHVYEVDDEEDKFFIVMEYVEGQSLREKLKAGALKVDEALDIAIQVSEGLERAHTKGIVHRDIKSANIMLTEAGEAKVMDFGLAKVTGSSLLTKEATMMGTVAYMSPEQAQGDPVDQRTDVWSMGVVLYELITGQLPFIGDHAQSVIYSILNREPKPVIALRSEVPKVLNQIIGKALQKNPDERYQSVADLSDDLRAVAKGLEPFRLKEVTKRVLKVKRLYLYTGMATLVILLSVTGLILFKGRPVAIDSIAVLPLANLSDNPEQAYITDGMTEALISELAQIKALRVISRQSVMKFKGSDKLLPEIARELGVDAIVEGSVLWVGQRVRITAQLIEGATDRHMWAEEYECDSLDILSLHSEIAQEIVREIKIAVTSEEEKRLSRVGPIDPEAYRLFLRGNFLLNGYTEEAFRSAADCFQQAIRIEPDYAASYAGLAMAYTELGSWHMASPEKEMYPKAKEAAREALKLDDLSAEAHFALGRIKFLFDWDWLDTDSLYKRGIELNPSSGFARIAYANFLTAMGRLEDSISLGKQSVDIDPLLPTVYNELGWAFQIAGKYDDAIEQYRSALTLDPDFHQTHWALAYAYFEKGMYREAILHCQKLMSVAGELAGYASFCGYIYALADKRPEALEILDSLIERSSQEYVSTFVAIILIALGDKDQAIEWLERAYKEHDIFLVWLKMMRIFDPLRADARFQDLLRRMNFPK